MDATSSGGAEKLDVGSRRRSMMKAGYGVGQGAQGNTPVVQRGRGLPPLHSSQLPGIQRRGTAPIPRSAQPSPSPRGSKQTLQDASPFATEAYGSGSAPCVNDVRQAEDQMADARRAPSFAGFGEPESESHLEKLIHAAPIFSECSFDFVETVLLHMKKLLYRSGQAIAEEGRSYPASMFIILWGSATVTCLGDKCKTLVEGQSFGEVNMLGLSPSWSSSVHAKTACMVCEVTKQCLEDALAGHPVEAAFFSSRFGSQARSRQERAALHWQALRHCASLRRCGEAFLNDLTSVMERKMFFLGENLVSEHREEERLIVLDHGVVSVDIAGRSVRVDEVPAVHTKLSWTEDCSSLLRQLARGAEKEQSDDGPAMYGPDTFIMLPPKCFGSEDADDLPDAVVFGEGSLLGISLMSLATVRATTVCETRVLYKQTLLRVLQKHPAEMAAFAPFLDIKHQEAFPPLLLRSSPLFAGTACSEDFFDFLQQHVEERIFGVGDCFSLDHFRKNVHAPESSDTFALGSICRLNKGRVRIHAAQPSGAKVSRRSFDVEDLGEGSYIMGKQLWTDRAQALEVCYVSILHGGAIARALEELPDDRAFFVPSLEAPRAAEAAQAAELQQQETERRGGHVANVLRERSIFSKTSPEFLGDIISHGSFHVFMPGDRIIEQGTDGNSMFILWVGTAHVVKEQVEVVGKHHVRTLTNVGALAHGSVFGELVMLGVQARRTASVIAASVCCTWEVGQQQILQILDRYPTERLNFLKLVEEHLDKLAATRIIYHQLLDGFHQQFRTLLGVNCQRKLYFPGETIVHGGALGDKLYIINLGRGTVQLNDQHVMQAKGGSQFGFNNVCQHGERERYPYTVKSETMCQVLMVTRSTFQHALHKYPEMRDTAKALEAEEKNRVNSQRLGFLQAVQKRRGLRSIIEALKGSALAQKVESMPCWSLESTFQAWQGIFLKSREARRAEDELRLSNARRTDEWLAKRGERMAKAGPKLELLRLVARNLRRRGPLKLGKLSPEELVLAGVATRSTSSQSWEARKEDSPYMSPYPKWKKWPSTPRDASMRLPPLPGDFPPPPHSAQPSIRPERQAAPGRPWTTGAPPGVGSLIEDSIMGADFVRAVVEDAAACSYVNDEYNDEAQTEAARSAADAAGIGSL